MKKNLPKISIITPSYNQGNFIETTIKSVLDQGYPDLEYIILDGGSTDNTLDILKKYNRQIKWISKKDKGQSDALNKGFSRVTGDILCFINSDDYLLDKSLYDVADFFSQHPEAKWVTGKCRIIDKEGLEVRKWITEYKNFYLKYLRNRNILNIVQFISQPSTFWRREVYEKIGNFDTSLYYDMDYDYWLRIWQIYPLYYLDKYLASYRVHPSSKAVTSPETQFNIEYDIAYRYTDSKVLLNLHRIHFRLALFLYHYFFANK